MDYKIEYLKTILEDDNPICKIANSTDLWMNFIHYNNVETLYAANEIANDDNMHKLISGLFSLYPLSESLLNEVLKTQKCGSVAEMKKEFSKWIDHSAELESLVNRIYSMISREGTGKEEADTLRASIARCEELKQQKNDELNSIKQFRQEHNKLIKEIEDIDKEIAVLNVSQNKKLLEQELDKKKKELDKKKKENEESQKGLEEEIRKVSDDIIKYNEIDANSQLNKAISALQKAIAAIPKSEGDR